MYDELIKELRHIDEFAAEINRPTSGVFREAADAIEELQKVANKLLVKYQEEATNVIWEYSGNIEKDIDRLNEEVRTLMAQINGMPLPEPPKEE